MKIKMEINRKTIYRITFKIFILMIISGCSINEVKKEKTVCPVLNMQVISISSSLMIKAIQGCVFIKRTDQSKYIKVTNEVMVKDGDILEIKENGSVMMITENNKSFVIDPDKIVRWYYFEVK